MTTVKKAPRKMIETTVCSMVGQKRIDSGIHASGGIGRRSSITGKAVPKKDRLIPIASPRGTPRPTPMA